MEPKKWDYLRILLEQLPAEMRRELYRRGNLPRPTPEMETPGDQLQALTWAVTVWLTKQPDLIENLSEDALRGRPSELPASGEPLGLPDAAVLLISLPHELSSNLFREMGPESIQKLTLAISKLPKVPPEKRRELVGRFFKTLPYDDRSREEMAHYTQLLHTDPLQALSSITRQWPARVMEMLEKAVHENDANPVPPPEPAPPTSLISGRPLYFGVVLSGRLPTLLARYLTRAQQEIVDLYVCCHADPTGPGEYTDVRDDLARAIGLQEMLSDPRCAKRSAFESAQAYLDNQARFRAAWLADTILAVARAGLGGWNGEFSRVVEAWMLIKVLNVPLEFHTSVAIETEQWGQLLARQNPTRFPQGLARRFLYFCLGRDFEVLVRRDNGTPFSYLKALASSEIDWFTKRLEELYLT